jgi:hypothetical protein
MPNAHLTAAGVPQANGALITEAVPPLLVPADVAGPMCGRSKASWWRDDAAQRVPAPAWRAPGRTLWSVEELRQWIEAGCPLRKFWETTRRAKGGGR